MFYEQINDDDDDDDDEKDYNFIVFRLKIKRLHDIPNIQIDNVKADMVETCKCLGIIMLRWLGGLLVERRTSVS